jgi:ABC-type transport system involved in cytochrome c biogenesis permease subunit
VEAIANTQSGATPGDRGTVEIPGSLLAGDPLALFSLVMWLVYAATLSGRAIGRWRGRRAAYFAIAGFCVLLATLGAGALFHGRHGS